MDVKDSVDEADNKYITRWLENGDRHQEYRKFRYISLSEREGMRKAVFEFLAQAVITYHNDPTEFSEIVARLGYEQAAQQFDKRPKVDKTRKGNFGEIIACEYLRQVENYELPVYRLRWNPNPDTSMRGQDAITFKFGGPDGTGREICITEAKVMSQYRGDTIQEAHTQLCSEHRPRPSSLPFIYTCLRERGEMEKATAVLDFLDRSLPHPPARHNFLMVITGNRPRDPFRVVEDANEVVSNLTASNLPLNQLTEFINELFEVEIGGDNTD